MLDASEESHNGIQKLTDEEIIGQTIIFLAAGSGTTACTLTFTVFYLTHHPEIQAKLCQEIDDATKSRGNASTYDFVHSLEYLDRVVSEVLRLAPVEFLSVRQCNDS